MDIMADKVAIVAMNVAEEKATKTKSRLIVMYIFLTAFSFS